MQAKSVRALTQNGLQIPLLRARKLEGASDRQRRYLASAYLHKSE